MMIKIIGLSCLLIFFGNKSYSQIGVKNIDSVFIHWNSKTRNSINYFLSKESDSVKKNNYTKRLEFLQYSSCSNGKISLESERYKFLKRVSSLVKNAKDFYIAETFVNSSTMVFMNSLVIRDIDRKIKVFSFILTKSGWHLLSNQNKVYSAVSVIAGKIINFNDKPFNYEDVIISKFDKSNCLSSTFYIEGSLSYFEKLDLSK